MRTFCRPTLLVCVVVTIVTGIVLSGCHKEAAKVVSKSTEKSQVAVNGLPPDLAPPSPYVAQPQGTLTFTKDIAPVVFQKCAKCHHDGEIAPFNLLCYTDVKKRARQIVEVTRKRIMPPWSPLPDYCVFERDGSLSVEQIGMLAQWVDEGAVEGIPSDLDPVPEFPSGWKYGQPDLVVTMPEPYEVAADTKDVFRKFVIRVPIEETKYVRAFDFDPGNRSVIHHMRLRVDRSSISRSQDQQDPLPGFDGTMIPGDVEPDGFFLVWAPGFEAIPKHADVAWTLQPGTDLVLELHMKGTGKAETVQSSIALYFRPTPPSERLYLVELESQKIDIPPGKKDDVYEDQYLLPTDITVLSVMPHAHYLGKDFRAYAVLPNGEKIWLMRIADWDFDWQREYTYAQPIFLPKGTTICMRILYDNSEDNPRNPYHPPQRVMIGRGTFDEMAEMIFQVQTMGPAAGKTLEVDFARRAMKALMSKELFLLERGRATSETHYNLGFFYSKSGNLPKALHHYRESIRLNPDNIFAVNNLGSVYVTLGQSKEAIEQYTRAMQINPKDARVHNNLGFLLMNDGRLDEAKVQLDEALRLDPELAEAQSNLGLIAAHQGDYQQAEKHFEQALKSNPNYQPARDNLLQLQKLRPESR